MASVRLRKIPFYCGFPMVSINCFVERAERSSFHSITVSPLRANFNASRKTDRSVAAPDICSLKIFLYSDSASAPRSETRFWSIVETHA